MFYVVRQVQAARGMLYVGYLSVFALPNASSSGLVCRTRCSVNSPFFFEPDTTAMYLQ